MAYPSYRAHVAAEHYTSTTVTVTKPTGTAEDDVLLCGLINNDGARVVNTVPSGWTLVTSYTTATAPTTGFWLYKKVAGGSEPASYDWVFNYDFNGRSAIVAVQAGSSVSVAGTAKATSGSTSAYAVDADAVTVPDDESLLVWYGALRVTTTGSAPAFTSPSGYTERIDSGASYDPRAISVADKQQATAGTSGTANGTAARTSAGAAHGIGVLVAISPVSGSSSVPASGEDEWPIISYVSFDSYTASTNAGNTHDLVVTVKDQDGDPIEYLTGTISSSDTNVATVSQLAATDSLGQATVRVTTLIPGSTTVTATFDSVTSAGVAVSVVQQASRIVSIVPSSASLEPGDTQTFSASLSGVDSPTFGWSVESGSGSIDMNGVFTASSASTAVIRATYSEDTNIYGEATVTVTEADTALGVVRTTWRDKGRALAGYDIDYWIISADDDLIASGSVTLDNTGSFSATVPFAYIGYDVQVFMNNLSSDLETAGKIHGQQVATVA